MFLFNRFNLSFTAFLLNGRTMYVFVGLGQNLQFRNFGFSQFLIPGKRDEQFRIIIYGF